MAQKVSINYTVRDQNDKTSTKSITNVNPNATGQQLEAFTEALIGLTTDTYVDGNRIDKQPLSEMKPTPTVEFGTATKRDEDNYVIPVTLSAGENVQYATAAYAGQYTAPTAVFSEILLIHDEDGNLMNEDVTVTVITMPNAQYASATFETTFHWEE